MTERNTDLPVERHETEIVNSVDKTKSSSVCLYFRKAFDLVNVQQLLL